MTMDADTPPNEHEKYTRDLFDLLGVMPEDQELLMVPLEMSVADALDLMRKHDYSQLPVSPDGKRAVGVFSYESYALAVVDRSRTALKNKVFNPLSLIVGDCLSPIPRFASAHNAFTAWDEETLQQGFVLVATQDRVQAMITPTDLLGYLYEVAIPYMLIADCELALRKIMKNVLRPEQLAECAQTCLASKYLPDKLPTQLHKMTLDDYESIITNGRWNHFDGVFGCNRTNTRSSLEKLVEVRNKLFHLRGDVTPSDRKELSSTREWLLAKVASLPAEGKTR